MPVETTERAIRFIFNAINKDFCVSEVRVAPGRQRRHDRWQLMVECDDVGDIPHSFILPKMGPEYEDLKIKVFVDGRKPCRDTSAPLPQPSHDEGILENTTDPNNTTLPLAQPAVLPSTTEENRQATPAFQNHPPTHTPSARPRQRPTPSPSEDQPNLKKVRPLDNTNPPQNSDAEQGAPDKDSERQAAIDAWREANLARIRAMTPEARAAWEAELAEKKLGDFAPQPEELVADLTGAGMVPVEATASNDNMDDTPLVKLLQR